MIIKFYCNNHCGDFTKDELELIYQKQSFRYCAFCGEKLIIENLTEIVQQDTKIKVRNNINTWFNEIGVDNTIDLVKRNKNQPCAKLYLDELKQRGFNIIL
jgi:uncharacterized protein YuzB (UPF0349 family)